MNLVVSLLLMSFTGWLTYVYPVRISSNVDLPAPDGPIMAVSSPARNSPLSPFKMVFGSGNMSG